MSKQLIDPMAAFKWHLSTVPLLAEYGFVFELRNHWIIGRSKDLSRLIEFLWRPRTYNSVYCRISYIPLHSGLVHGRWVRFDDPQFLSVIDAFVANALQDILN